MSLPLSPKMNQSLSNIFSSKSPSTPRPPLHSYGFTNKSLCERERNSLPLSRKFGENWNMNVQNDLISVQTSRSKASCKILLPSNAWKQIQVPRTRSTFTVDFLCALKCFNHISTRLFCAPQNQGGGGHNVPLAKALLPFSESIPVKFF